jgi:general secretion pathway protein F
VWYLDRQLQNPATRKRLDTGLLNLPRIGEMITRIEMARFARTLGTLLNNGVPLLTGVGLVKDVIANSVIANLMDLVVTSLEQGQRLAQPLKSSKYVPPLAIQLLEVGEESGQLEAMLLKIADIYDKDIQAAVKRLMALFEPVVILLLGGMIAVIILSILLALVGLNETIG